MRLSLWCKWFVFEAIGALAGVDVPVFGVVFPRQATSRQMACEGPLLRGVTFRWNLKSSACWLRRCDVGYFIGAISVVSFDGTHRSQTRAILRVWLYRALVYHAPADSSPEMGGTS